MLSQNADSMGVIDKQSGSVLLLEADHNGKVGQIAVHGVDAIDDNQLSGFLRKGLEEPFKILHVVVLELEDLAEGEAGGIDQGGVINPVH